MRPTRCEDNSFAGVHIDGGSPGYCKFCGQPPPTIEDLDRLQRETMKAHAPEKQPPRTRAAYTQHQLIVMRLEQADGWVYGYDLHKVVVVTPKGEQWVSHNAGRRARELARAGTLARREVDAAGRRATTGTVQYRIRS